MTMEVLRLRFFEPGRIASVQTTHVGGFAVKHVTRGMPSDVPVPRKMTSALFFSLLKSWSAFRSRNSINIHSLLYSSRSLPTGSIAGIGGTDS